MFEVERIYCSDIIGSGVRSFPDLVFEVERILHRASQHELIGTDNDEKRKLWKEAYAKLNEGDNYLSVIMDQALIYW